MINCTGQARALQQPTGRLHVLASHDLSELTSSSSLPHSLHSNHMDILALPQSCNHTHSLHLCGYCCFFWYNHSSGFCSFATSSVRPALIAPQIDALPIPHPALFFFMSALSDISYILHDFLKFSYCSSSGEYVLCAGMFFCLLCPLLDPRIVPDMWKGLCNYLLNE